MKKKLSKVDNVSTPELPHHKKAPRRYEVGEGVPDYPTTVQDHYRRLYFEVIDYLVTAIKERFNQKGFQMLKKLKVILKQKERSMEMLNEVCRFYGSDLNQERLQTQLVSLHKGIDTSLPDLKAIFKYLKSLDTIGREYYSEVIKVAKLILVMPATNALSERSFSALRRLKNWLHTRMEQAQLNWCTS